MKKNTLSLAFAGAALIAATGFGVATDDVSATPDVENDSRARSVADTPLAQLVEMPEPVEYYVASAGDIGLPPEDAPYTTDGFEIVGQYFDTDLGVGYVAISREDATSAKAELNLSPEYALESSNASHLRSDALSGDGRDSVVVVMSKYTAAQISSAMEQLTAHFQATGARVAFVKTRRGRNSLRKIHACDSKATTICSVRVFSRRHILCFLEYAQKA